MILAILLFIIGIIIFILLLILDFKMGRKHHHQNPRNLPFRQSTANYKLYKNGSPLYEDLFQDIANAQVQVDVFFYLIDNDYISQNFLQVLKKKAKEGIPVRLLGDRIGCFRIDQRIRKELKEAGVEFHFAEVPGFPYFFYRTQKRNHRKIAVIDGQTGYVGGFNIGKNYIGESPKFRDWRDYHLRLTGPIVKELHDVFRDDWYLASNEELEPYGHSTEEGKDVRLVATDGMGLEEEFLSMIKNAEKEILIGTPYFIPTDRLMRALKNALQRGVQLYIIVPAKKDHPLVKEAGLPYLRELYPLGANISFFDAGFYHAKVIMIDGQYADLGTANFDKRSLFLNKEVNLFIYNKAFIEELRTMYMEDFRDGILLDDVWIKNTTLTTMFKEKVAEWLRPLM